MRVNLDPSEWGEKGWAFLDSCLRSCDPSSRSSYVKFLRVLPEVLPCANCRRHTREFLTKNPPEDHHDLLVWLRDFRADVAARVHPQACAFSASTVFLLVLMVSVAAVLLGLNWPIGTQRASFAQR